MGVGGGSLRVCDPGHAPSPRLAPKLAISSHLQDVKKSETDSFSSLALPHFLPTDVMRINGITDEVPPRKQAKVLLLNSKFSPRDE